MLKKLFYCYGILLSLTASSVGMENQDKSGEHPAILIEDLANLTDLDLEFKDSDELELLLSKIDNSVKDPQNDFEGRFNVPEITDQIDNMSSSNSSLQFNPKYAELQGVKQEIMDILRERNVKG